MSDNMVSPLHRLEQNIARDLREQPANRPLDRDSVYSFDSVSTSGRLLDRLDLDEDYDEDYVRRRESYALIQLTGRLLDRLGLDEKEPARVPSVYRPRPARGPTLTPKVNHQFLQQPLLRALSLETIVPKQEPPVPNPNGKFDAALEQLVKKALQLKAQGNLREASYQLQLLGNQPYNYPKAMYLYAQQLRVGLGVKLNELLSAKWLCRCILVLYIVELALVEREALSNYAARLAEFQPAELVKMVRKNLPQSENDPFALFASYTAKGPQTIAKIVSNNAKDNNTVGAAYHKLAEAVYHGAGLPKDVLTAIEFYSRAAALGYSELMAALGELWSLKSKFYKKDYRLAAAWLRLGELFGRKEIGNSWIYKQKYMTREKKK